jgi:hypothetical protein
MIDKTTYAKCIKSLKAYHLSMNFIKYDSQKKQQSGDSISNAENKKCLCATISIREDISNRCAEPTLLTRKIEQRNMAKAAITVEKARTTEKIAT